MRGRSFSPSLSSEMPPPSSSPIAGVPAQVPGLMTGRPSRSVPWTILATLGRGLGILFFFVGTLVAVVFGSPPANCFNSTCNAGNTLASVQYGILTSEILWTLGALFLIAGAGIRLHFVIREPLTDNPESTRRYLAARRVEVLLVLIGIGVLVLLFLVAPHQVALGD